MVAVIVEAHTGRRLRFRAQRHQKLEFQRLLELAHRLHLTDAAEERIAGIVDPEAEAKIVGDSLRTHHPAFAEIGHVLGAAYADIFAHSERLQPVEMPRGFAAEAVCRDVEAQPARRQRSPRRRDRIDRIAGRGRQHEIGRRQRGGPVAAGVEAADRGVDLAFGAVQAADTAEQVGKTLQIAGFLQLSAAHDRRKAHHLGAGLAMPGDQGGEALDHVLIERGSGVDAIHAHPVEQGIGEVIERIGRLGWACRPWVADGDIHGGAYGLWMAMTDQWRRLVGTPLIRLDVAMLARILSLLIISGADSTSRRWRATLKSPSLR